MQKEQLKKGPPKKDHRRQYQQPLKQVKTNIYYDLAGLAIIILLGIIIYSNSFHCSFHFDDLQNIVNNKKIQNFSNIKAWLNFYPTRPIGFFTFALNYHFNQLDVRNWHLVNLIIHLINSCLVWWLTLLIFSSPALKDQPIIKHKNVIAFFTALLFVSHPLATQSVTYIVQRLASLVTMFYLFSLTLYVKARLLKKGKTAKYMLFACSFVSAILAMLTKENAFTLPFAIVLFEIFFLRVKKISVNFKDYRVILVIAIFLSILIILPLKFSFSVFNPILPQQAHNYTVTSLNYLLTQFSVIVKYIQLLFLPVNQNLVYDFPISNTFFGSRTIFGFLVLSSLIILAVFLFKKQRVISFGIFWFFLTLSVESSIIPIPNVIFEHRTYLPSVGFFLILSSGIWVLLWKKYKYLAISILVIIIGSNSYMTYERNKVWKDELSLWSDNAAKSPNIFLPVYSRGAANADLGFHDKAITDYSRAIEIYPGLIDSYYNRGNSYEALGQWDKAIADYSRAIGLYPNHSTAYSNRGVAYVNIGQWNKAIADFSRAIETDPEYSAAYSNRGGAYMHLGQWDKVIADCSKAIGLNPVQKDAWYNRGVAYWNLGQWDRAIADYSKVIEMDPKFINAYSNRGIAYGKLGQWDKAIADCSSAISIDPKNTNAYYNRGNIYVNLKLWDKAITDFSNVVGIDPKDKSAYYNRGNAYRNLGQWNKAIADYSKAIEIDPDFKNAYINREIAIGKLKR